MNEEYVILNNTAHAIDPNNGNETSYILRKFLISLDDKNYKNNVNFEAGEILKVVKVFEYDDFLKLTNYPSSGNYNMFVYLCLDKNGYYRTTFKGFTKNSYNREYVDSCLPSTEEAWLEQFPKTKESDELTDIINQTRKLYEL